MNVKRYMIKGQHDIQLVEEIALLRTSLVNFAIKVGKTNNLMFRNGATFLFTNISSVFT